MKTLEQTTASLGQPIWVRPLGGPDGHEVVVARWRHGSARILVSTPDAVRVVLSLSSGQQVFHSADDRAASAAGLPGHVSILPAGISTETLVQGDADVMQVFIRPKSLRWNVQRPSPELSLFESTSEKLKLAAISLFVAMERDDRRRSDAAGIDLRQVIDALLEPAASSDTTGTLRGLPSLAIGKFEQLIDEAVRGSTDALPNVEELAAAAHLSVSHFIRSVRQMIGRTPHQFVMLRRDERAMALLSGQELSVAEVGDVVGYSSPAHFVASFRQRFGVTPGAYRQALQSGLSAEP